MNPKNNVPEDSELIVIGGGIHGAMAAWDAALRGIRVLLLERGRFGGGTTANSLRIVHGGLRYLQQLDLRRMRETAREQRALLDIAPEWITPLRCVVPAEAGVKRSTGTYRAGFALARMALSGSVHPALPAPRTISPEEFRAVLPWPGQGYSHGAEWHDAKLEDPAGLIHALVDGARRLGAKTVEGVEVSGILLTRGRVTGVRAIDRETGAILEIPCRTVINAAGPWIGGLVPGVRNRFPRHWARALNLVLSVPPPKAAIGVPSPFEDPVLGRRFLFLVPDGERTLLGTSYRLEAEDEPALLERHAGEFREEWNRACPGFPIRAEDVTGIHAGRLPLRDGYQRGNPRALATQGRVLDHGREQAAGLYSIVGVKLTTARLLAERAVDQAAHQLGNRQPSRSASTALNAAGNGHPPRLRILVLAPHPFFQARGTPIAVRSVVEFLTRAGHSVDVLAYHEGDQVEIPGCRLFRIPRVPLVKNVRPGFSIKKIFCDSFMLASCLKLARRGRYDLIHAVEESVFMAAMIKKLTGIPFVYDMDSALVDQMVEKHPRFHTVQPLLERWVGAAIRLSEGIVAVCPALVDVARRHDPSKLVALVEDTTLLDGHYSGAEPIRDPRRDGTLFLYVGNLERYQGIDLLLEAFAGVAARIPGTLALIGGTPADIARYQEQARRLEIADRAKFLGPRPLEDLGGYLQQADVLVSPRLTGNNTPMKIYSYLDAGVPVLATRLATHTQVLTDQVALLVEPTPESMADGMVRLAQNAELRSRLAINARELAQREFTRAAADRKLASFYREIQRRLVSQPSPPSPRSRNGRGETEVREASRVVA